MKLLGKLTLTNLSWKCMQVEVRKFDVGGNNTEGAPAVVRACITAIPPGYSRIEIAPLSDQIWGSDGWDT